LADFTAELFQPDLFTSKTLPSCEVMPRFMPEIIYDANAAVIAISQMVQKAVVGVSDASLPMN
jgi:hypothetical protein